MPNTPTANPFLAALRAHDFNLPKAAASLPAADLLQLAADPALHASLEALLALTRTCLALQAALARHNLLSSLDTPATPEHRRAANTIARATDVRSLLPKPCGLDARPAPAAPTGATTPTPSVTHASMPPASMPSFPSTPPSTPTIGASPPRSLVPPLRPPTQASRLLQSAAAPPFATDRPTSTLSPDTG